MSNFKINQKVVCINPSQSLVINEIYTIEKKIVCKCGILLFKIKEHPLALNHDGSICRCGNSFHNVSLFNNNRFRPLHHEFAEEVISMLLEQTETIEL